MARDEMEAFAFREASARVVDVRAHQVFGRRRWRGRAVEAGVDGREHHRVAVRFAADHHAVELVEPGFGLVERDDAAVEHELQLGEVGLEATHRFVVQRRLLAVFLGG